MPSWVDHLVPAALRDDAESERRARLAILLSAVLIGTALAYALFFGLVVRFATGAAIVGTGATLAAVMLAILVRRPRFRAGGHLLLALLYGVLVGLVATTGGLTSPITPWLITPPVFGILLLGRRGAARWTGLCVSTIVAFHVADASGARFPVGYADEWAKAITLGSHAGLVICTAVLLFIFEDIRARAHARAESASAALAKLAYHDGLTGLMNRARFLECVGTALGRARAAGDPARVAVLMLDLDGFKLVNDAFGHAAGDAVLTQVAARLLNATRGCDTVARFGGDEFVVLLEAVREDASAQRVAERIVASLAAPFEVQGTRAVIGTSVGIARGSATAGWPADGPESAPVALEHGVWVPRADVAAVVQEADVAMYRAKALGKGRWVQFERETRAAAERPVSAPEGSVGMVGALGLPVPSC